MKKIPYEKSLDYINPELAKQWNFEKNGLLTPRDVTITYTKEVWWLLSYDVPYDYPFVTIKGKHFDFEWKAKVSNRHYGKQGCPFLSGKSIYKGFNDLETLNPKFASQWHPIKNGDLLPSQVALHYNKKVWWVYPYDDPKSNKHFDFEWEISPNSRVSKNSGCPYLVGQKVWIGFNDLETTNSLLAKEWHPTKNGKLTPKDVMNYTNKKVWWLYPFDDPRTGKHFEFEWKASVADRSNGHGCPFLPSVAKRQVWKDYNDLETLQPRLALEWHPTKNKGKMPSMYTEYSHEKVWWLLPYDEPKTGKHFDFEWEATIASRSSGKNCPYLSNEAVWRGFNDLETINPELAKEWSPNNLKKAHEFCPVSGKKVLWICHNGHEYNTKIANRSSKKRGCPYCAGKRAIVGKNDLYTVHKELCKEWNYERNRRGPETYTRGSGEKVWWKCAFGHEWRARISNRIYSGDGCPTCTKLNFRELNKS